MNVDFFQGDTSAGGVRAGCGRGGVVLEELGAEDGVLGAGDEIGSAEQGP
ncbi:hypothetical protein [Streptomyces sp. NPDC051554]